MKEDKENINPIQQVMKNGLPGLPQIIQNAMPVPLPRMNFDDGMFSMIFGTYKRRKMADATGHEAQIAANATRAVKEKLDAIHSVVTFSARVSDTLKDFEHRQTMRGFEAQRAMLENEKLKVETYKLQAEATTAGFDAKISELDFKLRLKQYKEVHGEEENE